jgi:4-hydroxy-tetrahydrodipicolinate synthase
MLRETLRGTGVALVTPFTSGYDIDFPALGRLIDFVLQGGVDYLVTLGTTGETPTLTKEEKTALIHFTCEKADGRVPVVVGIGGNNTQEVIRDLEHFPLDQATAILSASPAYSKPSQEGLFRHFQSLADASPLPVLLYNVPSRTGRNVNAETILRLAHEVKNLAGLKEAGGDLAQCMTILRDRPQDFLVSSGDDALALPQLACGMDGVISVAANCFPYHFSEMVRHCLHGDFPAAKKWNDSLIEGYEYLFCENNPAGVKAALAELGLISNYLRLPLVPLSPGHASKLAKYLSEGDFHKQTISPKSRHSAGRNFQTR